MINKKLKIVILIGDVGAGHRSPAQAIKEELESNGCDVVIEDLFGFNLKQKNRSISEKISRKIFDSLANHDAFESISKSNLIGFWVELTWHLSNTPLAYFISRRIVELARGDEIAELMKKHKPDIIISVHPFTNLLCNVVSEDYPRIMYVSVVTDLLSIHKSWADRRAHLIISPSEDATKTLIKYGIRKENIDGPYYPIRKQFDNPIPKADFKKSLGIDPNSKVVVITGGAAGIYSSIHSLKVLLKRKKYHLIIICGKAEQFKKKLEKKYAKNENVSIFGFVENIADFFNIADLVITKPGTNSLIELEMMNKKALFTRYIGAQEEGNVIYLKRNPYFRYIGNTQQKSFEKVITDLESVPENFPPRRFSDERKRIAERILKTYSINMI